MSAHCWTICGDICSLVFVFAALLAANIVALPAALLYFELKLLVIRHPLPHCRAWREPSKLHGGSRQHRIPPCSVSNWSSVGCCEKQRYQQLRGRLGIIKWYDLYISIASARKREKCYTEEQNELFQSVT